MSSTEAADLEGIEVSPFRTGMYVTPHVRLVQPLATGGMGELWIARHLTLASDVVVKFVRPRFCHNSVALARFRREARAAARISSPHVVRHFDHGLTDDHVPYIVMERLTGMNLAELVRDRRCLSLGQTAELVRQLGRALSEAHAAGIIHRDIKPENVFLCEVSEGLHVKLLDFGVAASTGMALAGTLTAPGTLVGTPSYVSPEQVLHDGPADEHADLWAVAAVAYEALTGRMAFDGETVGAVCHAVARCEVTAPSALNRTLPPEVDAWFARALCFERCERFATAQELAASFMALLDGDQAYDVPPPVRHSSRPGRIALDDDLGRPTLGAAAISHGPAAASARARSWRIPIAVLAVLALAAAGSRAFLDRGFGATGPFQLTDAPVTATRLSAATPASTPPSERVVESFPATAVSSTGSPTVRYPWPVRAPSPRHTSGRPRR